LRGRALVAEILPPVGDDGGGVHSGGEDAQICPRDIKHLQGEYSAVAGPIDRDTLAALCAVGLAGSDSEAAARVDAQSRARDLANVPLSRNSHDRS
jgi:hypothetical protein